MECACDDRPPQGWNDDAPGAWTVPVTVLLAVVLSSVLLLMTVGARQPNTQVVALFPPTWDADRSFAGAIRAGVDTVDFGLADWLLVVHGRDPDFADRLRAHGALIVLNTAVARFCGRLSG